jgi:two-component system cell cycle response regulator DivK
MATPLVLIADDYADIRDMYAEYLELDGSFRVMVASDGDEAVTLAKTYHPDVIVVDLAMPRLDGWGALRAMRAEPTLSHTPILILTGRDTDPLHDTARVAGCDGFLAKPCRPDTLVEQLESALRKGH